MKYRFLVCVILLAFCFNPATGFSAELAEKQVWRWGHHTTDCATLDPAFMGGDIVYSTGSYLFNGLVRCKPGTLDFDNLEGDLAESWEVSKDGLVYTFHLRKGVQWHRGYGEFTAEDVKATFDRLKDPRLGSSYASKFLIIDGTDVVDRYTVQIKLKSPNTFFIMDHAYMYQAGAILCKKQLDEKGPIKNLGHNVIGTGPFMFEKYKSKEKLTLVRNPNYFRGAPTLERLEIYFMPNVASRTMAFVGGDLDAIFGKRDSFWVEDVKKTKTAVLDTVPLGSGCALHFNMTRKPMDNIKVRKALAMTADREIYKQFFGDIWHEMTSPVPPSYYAALPKDKTPEALLYQGTVKEAKKLLAEAGYKDGFKISAFSTDRPYYKAILEICQELWKPLGVNLEIKVVDHTTFHTNIRKDMNDVIAYYAGRAPVADSYLTQWYHSKSAIGQKAQVTNFSHYGMVDADGDGKIDNADDLIDMARSELDPKKQRQLYYEAQIKILTSVPSKPLHELTKVFARHNWFDPGVPIKASLIFGYPLEKARILKH